MDEPLVIAAIVSLIGLTLTAVITGIFACIKVNNGTSGGCTNGLEAALQGQTKAMSELTTVLREAHVEDRGDHQQMIRALTILVERTRGNPE
jgi:hypothetical protein